MTDYEHTLWQTSHFRPNLVRLKGPPSSEFAREIEPLATKPGSLHVCLARASHENTTPLVISRFLGVVRTMLAGLALKELLDLFPALTRWDYGMEPLHVALHVMDNSSAAQLREATPEGTPGLVEALWLLGLSTLKDNRELTRGDLDNLVQLASTSTGGASVYEVALTTAEPWLKHVWASVLGVPFDRERALSERLWQNALAMAARHERLCDGQPGALAQLLRHAAAGGQWPLPCPANEDLKTAARELACEGFWEWEGVTRCAAPFALEVAFLSDPLEILNIGNTFDTCLRLGGDGEAHLPGWATNVNIRVVAARGTDGRILGRRTLGLSLEDGGVVREAPTYPQGYRDLEASIEAFVRQFLKDAQLRRATDGAIEDTCAPAYSDFG